LIKSLSEFDITCVDANIVIVGDTLLEDVCIRHLHNHDMTYVMNMK